MVDEEIIIKEILSGNTESFKVLVQRYERPVISMVKNLIGDFHECEDIAQDVFLEVYNKLGSFNAEKGKFSTWLFTIARNKSINILKKKRPVITDEFPELPATNTPIEELTEKEIFELLDKVLQTLSTEHKTAFVLAEFENLSYEEIAQIEGIKTGTVKSRINRAKEKLRKAVKGIEL